MLPFAKRSFLSTAYFLVACSLLFLLSGCASSWSAKVSSYQRWPDNVVGQTYRIHSEPDQTGNLEYEALADTVRAAIGPTGLTEGDANARFVVHLNYGSELKEDWVQRYGDPYFDGMGPFGPAWGGYFGHFGGFRGGMIYSPRVVTVPIQYRENRLTVIINDSAQNNAEVYRSTAKSISDGDNLLDVMSYLSQAVFDRFPGNNGEVREVRFTRNR
ncbi:DUF4136 domain-containing protein [Paenalcaligenes niemegkensis]|uniref:DUF4136 domain-containing protein n=1 Tax=Paenalcaligenes niemegkensis TaxID=2895469 RepID=UPI001EE961AD|nr:DUF4136 domain-containing protein [Paenalcaligenes niemegkensis]MCQ9616826.1 DUF4136 domain-containing protein [Paenalcaligenes niemegkensis]